jgi:hypothetical protein
MKTKIFAPITSRFSRFTNVDGPKTDRRTWRRSTTRAIPVMAGGVQVVGEVGEEEDKSPVVVGLKEPVKFCFFASNNRKKILDFSSTKGNKFFNSVFTKIFKMKSSFLF